MGLLLNQSATPGPLNAPQSASKRPGIEFFTSAKCCHGDLEIAAMEMGYFT